ncbi:Rha family transcriptional regulator [Salmonella enterica]|nr:hypothetical protein [Salmonella enterica]ECJ5896148.1 Rha family transcriptional regulator [Salmonella enterica subsp. diarizonae]ECS3896873.1 hypothetical protein [Salmonella enterica subsp. diarizonae serovar 48:i:z]EAM6407293.1 hypothetical protein [Salmonella enterica]EAN2415022.1 hypothetical protein [Salmonella enterica]
MRQKDSSIQGRGLVHPEYSEPDILVQHNREPRIDSRLIAERVNVTHEAIVKLVKKYRRQLRESGSLPGFEIDSVKKAGGRGTKHKRYWLLNEPQFDLLCHFIRGRDQMAIVDFKLDVTKAFAKRRASEPVRREYLPGYHESRDSLKAPGAESRHFINLAKAENRLTGLSGGARSVVDEQAGLLVALQKTEQAAFTEAAHAGLSPTEAVREAVRRMNAFSALLSVTDAPGVSHD